MNEYVSLVTIDESGFAEYEVNDYEMELNKLKMTGNPFNVILCKADGAGHPIPKRRNSK